MSGIILLVLVVLTGFYFVAIYNGLIAKRVSCDNAWSQIDVQLKRRHDLIPNIVESVKGYAAHEKDTLERVIQARNAAMSATSPGEVMKNENILSGALRQLFALSESYPDLKANQNFLQLQEELVATENRIGFSRQHYNDCVDLYNTSVQQFPASFIAGFGNFPLRTFFELSQDEKQAVQSPPKVSF